MTILIRFECPADETTIRHVNQAAFGGDDEANLVDALRDTDCVTVSLVAELNHEIVGHILFSPLEIITSEATLSALSLAPMAVLPDHQRKGIGRELITSGIEACRALGHRIVLVLGHPDYYPKFGFSAERAAPLLSPFGGGPTWMALELEPEALKGVEGTVNFAPPFGMLQ